MLKTTIENNNNKRNNAKTTIYPNVYKMRPIFVAMEYNVMTLCTIICEQTTTTNNNNKTTTTTNQNKTKITKQQTKATNN
jgi:hypothetical protein